MPPSQQGNGHVARRAAETTHAARDANTASLLVSTKQTRSPGVRKLRGAIAGVEPGRHRRDPGTDGPHPWRDDSGVPSSLESAPQDGQRSWSELGCRSYANCAETVGSQPFNGEGGIRTLDGGVHPHNALAGRRLQPLGHFSRSQEDIGRRGPISLLSRGCGRPARSASAP